MAPNAPPSPGEPAENRKLDVAAQHSPPRSSSPSPIPLPSKQEREGYYFGLHSQPPLVARTSTAVWDPLDSSRWYWKRKELAPACHDKLHGEKWFKVINPEIIETLNRHNVRWNCIHCVRIGYQASYGEEYCNPDILWIGVCPGALANEDGSSLPISGKVALACKRVLEKYDILDVDCEITETTVHTMELVGPVGTNKAEKACQYEYIE
jgi:hypothetical protein